MDTTIEQGTFTCADIMSWGPCEAWPESRVRAALRGLPRNMTAEDVLRRDTIPAEDRLWVVLREECLDPRTLRLFACSSAQRALERERAAGREPDPRSWAVVDVARRFAAGETSTEELDAAWDAAWAAGAAAGAAARCAGAAARDAAWAAAAGDAARSAAGDAERERQVADLLALLGAP